MGPGHWNLGYNSSQYTRLAFTMDFPEQARNVGGVGLDIQFPLGTRVIGCTSPTCSSDDELGAQGYTLGFYPTSAGGIPATILYVNTPNILLASNGETALGSLLDLQVIGKSTQTPKISLEYDLPGAANYQWTGPLIPSAFSTYLDWGPLSDYPTGQVVTLTGIRADLQSSDSTWTFLAGAFVGIAGAALVGLLTEFLHSRRSDINV